MKKVILTISIVTTFNYGISQIFGDIQKDKTRKIETNVSKGWIFGFNSGFMFAANSGGLKGGLAYKENRKAFSNIDFTGSVNTYNSDGTTSEGIKKGGHIELYSLYRYKGFAGGIALRYFFFNTNHTIHSAHSEQNFSNFLNILSPTVKAKYMIRMSNNFLINIGLNFCMPIIMTSIDSKTKNSLLFGWDYGIVYKAFDKIHFTLSLDQSKILYKLTNFNFKYGPINQVNGNNSEILTYDLSTNNNRNQKHNITTINFGINYTLNTIIE